MNNFHAVDGQGAEQAEAGFAPAYCRHPNECPRASRDEPRNFGDRRTKRWLRMDVYRRLLTGQCACNAPHIDLKA